jgi:hypothetical protein
MTNVVEESAVPNTTGNVIHGAFRYDLLLWWSPNPQQAVSSSHTIAMAIVGEL